MRHPAACTWRAALAARARRGVRPPCHFAQDPRRRAREGLEQEKALSEGGGASQRPSSLPRSFLRHPAARGQQKASLRAGAASQLELAPPGPPPPFPPHLGLPLGLAGPLSFSSVLLPRVAQVAERAGQVVRAALRVEEDARPACARFVLRRQGRVGQRAACRRLCCWVACDSGSSGVCWPPIPPLLSRAPTEYGGAALGSVRLVRRGLP